MRNTKWTMRVCKSEIAWQVGDNSDRVDDSNTKMVFVCLFVCFSCTTKPIASKEKR